MQAIDIFSSCWYFHISSTVVVLFRACCNVWLESVTFILLSKYCVYSISCFINKLLDRTFASACVFYNFDLFFSEAKPACVFYNFDLFFSEAKPESTDETWKHSFPF